MSEVPLLHTLLPYKHTLRASDFISEESMATMQLFNGETTYGTKERKKVLTSILRVRNTQQGMKFCPRAATERLVEMRGHDCANCHRKNVARVFASQTSPVRTNSANSSVVLRTTSIRSSNSKRAGHGRS